MLLKREVWFTEGNAIDRKFSQTKKRSIEITLRGMLDSREKNDRSQIFTKRNAIDRWCLRGRFDSQREMQSIANFHKQKCDRSKLLKMEVWFQREMQSITNFHIDILRSIVLSIFHNYIFKIYKNLFLLQTLRAFFQCTYKF